MHISELMVDWFAQRKEHVYICTVFSRFPKELCHESKLKNGFFQLMLLSLETSATSFCPEYVARYLVTIDS